MMTATTASPLLMKRRVELLSAAVGWRLEDYPAHKRRALAAASSAASSSTSSPSKAASNQSASSSGTDAPLYTLQTAHRLFAQTPPLYTPPLPLSAPRPHTFHSGFTDVLGDYIRPILSASLQQDVLFSDSHVRVIYDKYPKAQYHLLVLPLNVHHNNVTELTAKDMPLLQHIQQLCTWLIRGFQQASTNIKHQSLQFNVGFHRIPSLKHLHVHLISTDYNSPWLKTKKHWLSFSNSDFFVSLNAVTDLLQAGKSVVQNVANDTTAQQILDQPSKKLRCQHVGCGQTFNNMPKLKAHIEGCRLPLPTNFAVS